jgi:hypothetical protein
MVKSAKPVARVKPAPEAKPDQQVPKDFLPRALRVALVKPAKPAKPETPATPVRMVQSAVSALWLAARVKLAHKAMKGLSARLVKQVLLAKLAPLDNGVPALTAIWATLDPLDPLGLQVLAATLV